MPSIADSLARFNYGRDFASAFEDIYRKIQADRQKEAINQMMTETFDLMRNAYRPETIRPESPNYDIVSQTRMGLTPNQIPTGLSRLAPNLNIPSATGERVIPDYLGGQTQASEVPRATALRNIQPRQPVTMQRQMTPEEQSSRNNELLFRLYQNLMGMENLPQGRAEQIVNAFNLLQPQVAKTEYRSFKPEEDIYRITNKGAELIKPGKVKEKTETAKYLTDIRYKSPDTGNLMIFNATSGKPIDTGIPYELVEDKNVRKEQGISPSLAFQMQKYMKELSDEEAEKQRRYNQVMATPWYSNDEIKRRIKTAYKLQYPDLDDKTLDEIINESGLINNKYGGAFIPTDNEGNLLIQNAVYTSKELKDKALNEIGKVPNAWERKNPEEYGGKDKTKLLMDKDSFIKDFEKEYGVKPTEKEINNAKGKYWQ